MYFSICLSFYFIILQSRQGLMGRKGLSFFAIFFAATAAVVVVLTVAAAVAVMFDSDKRDFG